MFQNLKDFVDQQMTVARGHTFVASNSANVPKDINQMQRIRLVLDVSKLF